MPRLIKKMAQAAKVAVAEASPVADKKAAFLASLTPEQRALYEQTKPEQAFRFVVWVEGAGETVKVLNKKTGKEEEKVLGAWKEADPSKATHVQQGRQKAMDISRIFSHAKRIAQEAPALAARYGFEA